MLLFAMNDRWLKASASLLLGCLLFVASLRCEAQNLVPNPSFEELDTCPYWPGAFRLGDRPLDWYSWNGTPEYFNSCAQEVNGSDTVVGVPLNGWGFQYAWDGDAYVGVYSYATGDPYREYVGAELICPMVVGRTYHVSFRVNLASGGAIWGAGGACNNIGALFTMESNAWTSNASIPTGPFFPIRNMAHVFSSEIVTDTLNWILVEGDFEADSAYNNIVLGNFFDNAHTETIPSDIGFVLAFYMIDSVSVTSAFEDCLSVGAMENQSSVQQLAFYDQRSECLVIEPQSGRSVQYSVIDPLGKFVLHGNAIGTIQKSTSDWPIGIYLLRTVDQLGEEAEVKFVVVH